ncbi:PVC-type heme-binding CxxCH protein [Haloferula rosea]|uniref:C-type cytochrome n=1 Tax=Haloferula rosea TaxID=490093 RepID=A0A934VET8_9BACT|nr:PVC-type heme-binding CxxCH protein [Haloferula rosea]MBK1827674.1 c-type cytochrome [Haloferula rosea]
MTKRATLTALAACSPLLAADWNPPQAASKVAPMAFEVPEGLEVTVWASTPDLFNPTNMDIDAQGRIWVAEGVNYRRHKGRRPGGDRIVVLQDTDGDGKADSSHTFVQEEGLIAPLGVGVFDNVVVVSQPPDLIVYTDVDRDLKFDPAVDKREVLLTGFNARNHDHSLHSVTGGPDGKWYFNNGNCGAIFTDRSDKTFTLYGAYKGGGGDWFVNSSKELNKASDDGFKWTSGFSARMNPDGTEVEIIGHGYRNSYEHAVNSFGELFQNDNDDPPACRNSYVLEYGSAGYFTREGQSYRTVKRPGQDHGRAHWRQDDPGTFDVGDIYGGGSPTGVVFYENGALGDSFAGTFLSCEAGRNVIFSYQPEVQGAGYKMERGTFMNSNHDGKFVGSDFVGGGKAQAKTDKGEVDPKQFRPSDVAVGADGAIYVTDWFDPRVGGHADHDDSCSGTIYRIAPKGFKAVNPEFDLNTIEGAIAALRSPAPNVRWTGFDALRKQGAQALPAVSKLLGDKDPWIAIRGVWLLPYLGEDGITKCTELLKSGDERIQLVAFRALKRAGKDVYAAAAQLAHAPSAALRRDAALAMRGLPADKAAPVLIEVAKHWDGSDKNYLEAIGLGAENQEPAVWTAMRETLSPGDPLKWNDSFAKLTWRLWPTTAIGSLKARAMAPSLTKDQREFAIESLSFIDDPAAADAMFDLVTQDTQIKPAATRWLFARGTGAWARFGLKKRLKETGIYDPAKIEITEIIMPGKPASTKFSDQDVLKLKGDAERGKSTAMRCAMCHNINDVGPHYGPDLRGWVARQGEASAVRSIIDPSADIAHGFGGTAVNLKNGKWIDGLIIADGDPVVITANGGITQMVPKNRIKSRQKMNRSLMLNADQLGLSAQDVADIVEWLKSY